MEVHRLRTAEVLQDLEVSKMDYQKKFDLESNRVWIRKLLLYYYDPLYENKLSKKEDLIIFRGNREEVKKYCVNL